MVHNSAADANASSKLADEVAKADPWAMIDKIKDAKVSTEQPANNNSNQAGVLATGAATANSAAGAKTNADLAAAVALKTMIKDGKFSVNNTGNEGGTVKGAAASAVNKVLGVLDEIIKRTVASELFKIREAVNKIQYSETTGTNATEASTSNR